MNKVTHGVAPTGLCCTCVCVCVCVFPCKAGRAIERETLMISSEEEDGDSSSAEESEEDTLYKSEPLPKPISVVKKQKREQELKEVRWCRNSQ